jgi:polar amino acid transport system substrate-binding protein
MAYCSSVPGRVRHAVAGVLVLGLAAAVTACGSSEGNAGNTLEQIQDRGYVNVGFGNEAPFSYTDGAELKGQEIAINRAIFAKLGVDDVRGTQVDFGQLIPGLNADRYDLVGAGMFITPERCAQAAFSLPSYTVGTAFLVQKGNPANIATFDDIRDRGLKIAMFAGSAETSYAKRLGIPASQIINVSNQRDGAAAVATGRADAFTGNAVGLRWNYSQDPDDRLEITDEFAPVIDGVEQRGYGATTFRKEDTELIEAFNAELTELRDSGELLKLVEPFGFTAVNIPGPDVSVDSLCES